MGVLERREREKTELREKILEAARELFLSEGYDRVSMRKVAEKIEYSPTAIYLYFADKEELFHELCQEDFARLASIFQERGVSPDPLERIRQIGRLYVEFGMKFPNHYRLMFMTPHPPSGLQESDLQRKGNPELDAYAFLNQTVQEALQAGSFREVLTDPDLISQTLWAAIHGVISLGIAKCEEGWVEFRPTEQRADVMLEGILYGLLREKK
ncbi:MAG TPA: TetR/AcrR family transcriptional regulator [Candidatus Angelobacter sp.]|nr:TetR/AcrR family transcriptional regulator [Candidatus Angelobacter sp.]